MSYENNEEFRDYVPHTNDPGDLVLFGTIGICVGLLLVAHLLISVVQRRQKRRRADREARARLEEAAIREASENFAASDLLPDAEAVFERRVFKKDGRRLKGWNEIVTSIEENQERPPGKVPPDAAEMLQRDLFEDGGVVDQLNGYMSKETTIRESPDDAMSDATAESSVAGSEYVLMHGQQPQERAVGTCRYLFSLLRPDRELRKLLKLAIPYSVSSLLESVFDILTLALIGRLLGTRELSAYVMTYYAVGVGTMFLEGLLSSLTSLCAQAIGNGKYVLAGQYVQISVLLYELLFIPQIYLWWNHFYDLMIWMQFDAQAAAIGQNYARVFVVHSAIEVFHSAIVLLLEVCGHETFVAITTGVHSFLAFVVKFVVLFLDEMPFVGKPTLQMVGFIDLAATVFFFSCEMHYVSRSGWLRDYMPGLFGSFAPMNVRAVKNFLRVALPLSCGFVLSYGEWEVLFILASMLGPAEVAVWGILGEIWGALEKLTSAWGDAAEVRCGILLGAGQPILAERSAHKALLLGTSVAGVVSAALFATANYLPALITEDRTMQYMVGEALPLIALGNVSLALGTISWQLVGAQNRYSLATAVELLGSWLVTLPLAVVSCIFLQWTLEGLIAAVVVGCMCSGMLNYAILRCTKWERISERIVRRNEKMAGEDQSSIGEDEESGYEMMGDNPKGDGLHKIAPFTVHQTAQSEQAAFDETVQAQAAPLVPAAADARTESLLQALSGQQPMQSDSAGTPALNEDYPVFQALGIPATQNRSDDHKQEETQQLNETASPPVDTAVQNTAVLAVNPFQGPPEQQQMQIDSAGSLVSNEDLPVFQALGLQAVGVKQTDRPTESADVSDTLIREHSGVSRVREEFVSEQSTEPEEADLSESRKPAAIVSNDLHEAKSNQEIGTTGPATTVPDLLDGTPPAASGVDSRNTEWTEVGSDNYIGKASVKGESGSEDSSSSWMLLQGGGTAAPAESDKKAAAIENVSLSISSEEAPSPIQPDTIDNAMTLIRVTSEDADDEVKLTMDALNTLKEEAGDSRSMHSNEVVLPPDLSAPQVKAFDAQSAATDDSTTRALRLSMEALAAARQATSPPTLPGSSADTSALRPDPPSDT